MKIPLAFTLKNRASSLAEDAKLLNGYVETRGDPKKGGLATVEKRPAMDSAFELTAGTGQGIYVPNTPDGDGEPGVIIGDILTRAPNPKKKKLAFGVQPSGVVLNTAISPAITVRILDSIGNLASGATDAVTIALSSNPTGATLGGTLTQNAVAGVATFNDITLDRSGENFTIIATASGLNSATSNAFTLATSLAFTTQPVHADANVPFTVVVTSRDTAGNTDTNYTGTVTLSLWSATGNGIPTGDFIVDAVAGVATFANISLSDGGVSGNADGTYQFVARADQESFVDYYIPAAAVSNSFDVGFYTLTIQSDSTDYNVATEFINKYGSQPSDITLQVTINSLVVVSATATSNAAVTWGSGWSGTNTFTLTNNGYVIGKGGAGSQGGFQTPSGLGAGAAGLAGGKAMELSGQTVTITNGSGFIWGGGGGGGGGGAAACGFGANTASPGGGGGGGGAGDGGGGSAGTTNPPTGDGTSNSPTAGTASSGSLIAQTGGISGVGATGASVIAGSTATGGDGGAGGDYGTAGTSGADGAFTGLGVTFSGGSGGAAGKAINLTGGTANFLSGSGSPNVKGVVS